MTYLALLRGINVGGKAMIKMADLKACFEAAGYSNVRTYIQSGNVIFETTETDKAQLKFDVEKAIQRSFKLPVQVAIFVANEWRAIVKAAPKTWGQDKSWKHNLLIMLEPVPMQNVTAAVGDLKPDIEAMTAGDGVLYQSMSLKLFGRTTTGKLASNPVYKKMTIRNYNTTLKLLELLEKE